MTEHLFEFDKKIFEVVFEQENVQFLSMLNEKIEKNDKEIADLGQIKSVVVNKIAAGKKEREQEPKDLREYITNAESVLESIDAVYNNLTELQNNYRGIEKSLLLTVEKNKIDMDDSSFKTESKILLQKIELTKLYEINVKNDNEKNYYIINSFLSNSQEKDDDIKVPVDFFSLTKDNLKDNLVLRICEKRVELPYTKREIEQFMEKYPEDYKTVQEVITKEYMVNMLTYNRHPALSRFREAYYLCRNKEMMPVLDSFNYAKNIMFRREINPYIIAAVKSKKQLEDYIDCLEKNELENFKHFKIIFEVNPLSM